jgi:hypothetical protein
MRSARSVHAASIRYAGRFSGPRSDPSPRAPRSVDLRPLVLFLALLALSLLAAAPLLRAL